MTQIIPLSDWGVRLAPHGQMIISGPCAAESEVQVLATARAVAAEPLAFFRAGVWKPRTRPGTFEGMGETALPWLIAARQATQLPLVIEVANARHVQLALEAGVDALWIGARTSVTPFAVQEIADALRGVDIPVLIKNPINPDLELWTGAIERICNVGIRRVAAVLRGCSGIAPGAYRNAPAWQLAFDLKRRFADLPCLCDPSHIAGKVDYIHEVAQQAMNLGFDGLMVETHETPQAALSDRAQQLTPAQLHELLSTLVFKSSEEPASGAVQQKLAERRLEIDQLDTTLITTLARRMAVSQEIGSIKRNAKLTVLQSARWEQVLAHVMEMGEKQGLNPEFIRELYERIHLESIQQQQ